MDCNEKDRHNFRAIEIGFVSKMVLLQNQRPYLIAKYSNSNKNFVLIFVDKNSEINMKTVTFFRFSYAITNLRKLSVEYDNGNE